MRILVVEDEVKVARALQEGLQGDGYDVVLAGTGEDAFFIVSTQAFDLVVLDLMLPGRSGLEILAGMRGRGIETPVLILTARDAIAARVAGLDAGADDYLVKPFAFAEFQARVRALLRRGGRDASVRIKVADLELDVSTHQATRSGTLLALTAREFGVLEYLLRHKGVIVSREMLARDVWKEPLRGTPLD